MSKSPRSLTWRMSRRTLDIRAHGKRPTGLIEYPFPLRENIVARLMLPRDISAAEVKRLHGFMMALAVDSAAKE